MPANYPSLFGLLLALQLVGIRGHAADIQFFSRPLMIPERGPVTSYVLQKSDHRFAFLPPPEWRLNLESSADKLTMLPTNLTASISFTIQVVPTNRPSSLDASWLRGQLARRFDNAEIIREFPCYTSDQKGLAFDLEIAATNGTKMAYRIAFVPYAGGLIEFDLAAPARQVADYHFAFANLLTSFRIESQPAPKP
jgi:hypothetical protein